MLITKELFILISKTSRNKRRICLDFLREGRGLGGGRVSLPRQRVASAVPPSGVSLCGHVGRAPSPAAGLPATEEGVRRGLRGPPWGPPHQADSNARPRRAGARNTLR